MSELDPFLSTLADFKDFTNYLLVTTVAVLAWVADGKGLVKGSCAHKWTLGAFALSMCAGSSRWP